MSDRAGKGVNLTTDERSGSETDSKSFAARTVQQQSWSELLRGLVGPKRGLLSTIVLGNSGPKQAKVESPSKSRLVLISGPAGVGKTRLGLRLRQMAQHDKEFTRRFRTTRLDWVEARERDIRLAGLQPGQPLPAEILLDVIHNHLEREDLAPYLSDYQQAVEETTQLSLTVTGAELNAVWEYRARALGRSLKQLSSDKPLVFFLDNFNLSETPVTLLQPIFEETGSLVVWVLIGAKQSAAAWANLFATDRLLELDLAGLSADEMRQLLEIEINRYKAREENSDEPALPVYKSPDKVVQLTELSDGLPLAARMLTYMLESGMTLDEFEDLPAEGDKITLLLNKMLGELLGPGHPDYLKIYAFGLLRRPERGLLGALLDLRQDMLPVEEILRRINARYEFMFEPNRQMKLHGALEQPLRLWMLAPARRTDANGLVRINRRALSYLEERLHEWGLTFNSLKSRVGDVKWTDWALDKIWHSFWQDEESGWAEAVPLFVAALGYKPTVAVQIAVMLEELQRLHLFGPAGNKHLSDFQASFNLVAEARHAALQNLQEWSSQQNWFGQRLASIDELERILEKQLALA